MNDCTPNNRAKRNIRLRKRPGPVNDSEEGQAAPSAVSRYRFAVATLLLYLSPMTNARVLIGGVLCGLGLMLGAGAAWADARAEVYAAWDAMVAAGKYRTRIDATAMGQRYQQTIEIALPDRVRVEGGPGGDLVITPDGGWMRLPGAGWTEAPQSTRELSKLFLSADYLRQSKDGVRSVSALPAERLGGRPVRVYRIEQTMTVLKVQSSNTITLYVDAVSGRPLRQIIEAEAAGQHSHTVQDIEYPDTLDIVPPVLGKGADG